MPSVRKPIFALVDCNNFFVSCERVFRPDLWEKPVAVLSNNDGCIVARSNEVKAMGVPMGVPYFEVKDVLRKNNVTLFSGNFPLYGDFSQRVVRLLQDACPEVEVYSVDESFLDISSLPINDYEAWGKALREKIFACTGLPVSIGIAPSKTLAKAAADLVKKTDPARGAYSVLDDQKRIELLKWLPIQDVWGVGWRTAPKLRGRGVKNGYDLSLVSDHWALTQLSIRGLKTVRELRGESCFAFEHNGEPQKSIARTRSFGHTVRNYYELEGAIATFAAQAAAKLRGQGELARGVMTYLRTSRHTETQHSGVHVTRLHPASGDTGAIINAALKSLAQVYDPDFGYKKAGVVLLDLHSQSARQLTFTDEPAQIDKRAALMATVDTLNARFHGRLVRHASEHLESTLWHSKRELRSPAYTTQWQELRVVKS